MDELSALRALNKLNALSELSELSELNTENGLVEDSEIYDVSQAMKAELSDGKGDA